MFFSCFDRSVKLDTWHIYFSQNKQKYLWEAKKKSSKKAESDQLLFKVWCSQFRKHSKTDFGRFLSTEKICKTNKQKFALLTFLQRGNSQKRTNYFIWLRSESKQWFWRHQSIKLNHITLLVWKFKSSMWITLGSVRFTELVSSASCIVSKCIRPPRYLRRE